ncbi:peptidase M48-like protein [Barrientosiimonas humi]|uniref:Peptidase M48-like protein n=2 Tax=Barrientosiimonas humi TaxID=999931 RepID=A0A542WZ82_9MICO|nr:peptidase M48-like protein [Barrientosiimonas humi]CAG7571236.1 Protease HtpX [Barrientosiimonas humi]
MAGMYSAALVLLSVALAGPAPRLLARLTVLRKAPAAALVLWQSISLAALIAGLAAAPVAVQQAVTGEGPALALNPIMLVAGFVVTGFLAARLLLTGHRTGTALRRARREHRELVDLIGLPGSDGGRALRVLEHPTATAYCLPGRRSRVVLSAGTLQRLSPTELGAVLAHERTHLRFRHDLVLEFFTVLHTAVPERVRSNAGMHEVRLLLELHADQHAVADHRPRDLGSALVTLAGSNHPEAGLGAGGGTGMAGVRLRQLRDPGPHRGIAAVALLAAALILACPIVLVVAALA